MGNFKIPYLPNSILVTPPRNSILVTNYILVELLLPSCADALASSRLGNSRVTAVDMPASSLGLPAAWHRSTQFVLTAQPYERCRSTWPPMNISALYFDGTTECLDARPAAPWGRAAVSRRRRAQGGRATGIPGMLIRTLCTNSVPGQILTTLPHARPSCPTE